MADNSTHVIMPVLGMSQDRGKVLRWLKTEGSAVVKGEPLIEVETDKAVAEIEAPASGVLVEIRAREGQEVPVTAIIAVIAPATSSNSEEVSRPVPPVLDQQPAQSTLLPSIGSAIITASPLAARIAAENQVDLSLVKPAGGRVEKDDVLAYLQKRPGITSNGSKTEKMVASPKARRLAAEYGLDLAKIAGSGPQGAVIAQDILDAAAQEKIAASTRETGPAAAETPTQALPGMETLLSKIEAEAGEAFTLGSAWRLMAERTTASWTSIPHFFLMREVSARRLLEWRDQAQKGCTVKITITDLLVKAAAASLKRHPRINALCLDGAVRLMPDIHIGLAMAMESGLAVPVIQNADRLGLREIAEARGKLVERARANRLQPDDLTGGTFTISNLGMYGVDAFNAVINAPQAAILAVGRIAERVAAAGGQPVVQPMMTLSASFDHRVVDGARAAQFLQTLAEMIEEPLGILS